MTYLAGVVGNYKRDQMNVADLVANGENSCTNSFSLELRDCAPQENPI